jgi:phosphoglycolate phosphatase-like HAD superfamily hydrolase
VIPKNLRLVILDCDGVLFDSFRSNVAYYNRILEGMGEPVMDAEGERLCHVLATPQLFEQIFSGQPGKLRRALRISGEIDYAPFLAHMDPEPGLYSVLGALKDRYRLAMATNRGKSVGPLLKGFRLEGVFESVSTILHVPSPKPAPDLLLHCLEETGVPPHEAVYVGDMENDRTAAEAAAIPFILKGNGFRHPLCVRSLLELPGFLAAGGPETAQGLDSGKNPVR